MLRVHVASQNATVRFPEASWGALWYKETIRLEKTSLEDVFHCLAILLQLRTVTPSHVTYNSILNVTKGQWQLVLQLLQAAAQHAQKNVIYLFFLHVVVTMGSVHATAALLSNQTQGN